jgi:hypothetical protein
MLAYDTDILNMEVEGLSPFPLKSPVVVWPSSALTSANDFRGGWGDILEDQK